MRIGIIAVIVMLSTMACGQGSKTPDVVANNGEPRKLDIPLPPETVTDPYARLDYVVERYWNEMPWEDSRAMADTAFIEQSLVNFLEIIQHGDSTRRAGAFTNLLDSMDRYPQTAPRRLVMQYTTDYLFSADSPEYNLDSYAAWIDVVVGRGLLTAAERDRMERHHALIMRNRPGTRATDFEITTRQGKKTSLKELVAKNARKDECQVILFFYDPDCDNCAEVEARLAADERMKGAIQAGNVVMIAVDPFGTDYDEWKRHADTLPQEWIVGYSPDGSVDEDELYLLNATPMTYLLGRDLTVLIRDAQF